MPDDVDAVPLADTLVERVKSLGAPGGAAKLQAIKAQAVIRGLPEEIIEQYDAAIARLRGVQAPVVVQPPRAGAVTMLRPRLLSRSITGEDGITRIIGVAPDKVEEFDRRMAERAAAVNDDTPAPAATPHEPEAHEAHEAHEAKSEPEAEPAAVA